MLGVQLGSGDVMVPLLAGAGALMVMTAFLLNKNTPIDAVVLLLAISGFVIAGKGFAYQRLGAIFFVGELTLAFTAAFYVIRWMGGRQRLIPSSPMALALVILGSYSLLHLLVDFQQYGIMALRDSCMIYYTILFFVAYQLGLSAETNSAMRRFLLCIAPIGLLVEMTSLFPSVRLAMAQFSVGGVPLLLPHADATVHMVFGLVFFLYFRWEQGRPLGGLALLALLMVLGYIAVQARGAAYVTLFFVAGLFLLSRRFKFFLVTIPAAAVALVIALGVISSGMGSRFELVKSMKEQFEALNPFAVKKMDTLDKHTAEWRLYWWKKITKDVTRESPFTGFGFGADISSSFIKEFFRLTTTSEQHERTRGAHNVFFTILGRLGWIGALLFVVVVAVQCYYFLRMLKAVRRGWLTDDELFVWGLVSAGFVVGFFQYAWEAPYSAIPYWVYCGLAYSRLDEVERSHAVMEPGLARTLNETPQEKRVTILAPPRLALQSRRS